MWKIVKRRLALWIWHLVQPHLEAWFASQLEGIVATVTRQYLWRTVGPQPAHIRFVDASEQRQCGTMLIAPHLRFPVLTWQGHRYRQVRQDADQTWIYREEP